MSEAQKVKLKDELETLRTIIRELEVRITTKDEGVAKKCTCINELEAKLVMLNRKS